MAHAATLSSLAAGLVTSVTGVAADEARFNALKDGTLMALRGQSHARTNQFAVRDTLAGLVEKFAVRNRDDLSDALQSRLEQLPHNSRWLPEILALFLVLSDRPLEKTQLENLHTRVAALTPEPSLTWDDIVADGPFDEPDIWEDVERGHHSSGDDEIVGDAASEPTESTQGTSVHEDDLTALATLHLLRPDDDVLSPMRHSREPCQAKGAKGEPRRIFEVTFIRETLALLRGLPSELLHPSNAVAINGLSQRAVSNVSERNFKTATTLRTLRHWIGFPETLAYTQSLQNATGTLMHNVMSQLSLLETRYVDIKADMTVSIIEVQAQIDRHLRPLLCMASTLPRISPSGTHDFSLLDSLFDAACIAQMSDDHATYNALATVFLAGLETYFRAADAWIRHGKLLEPDQMIFFIRDSNELCDLSDVWHSRFEMRQQSDGQLYAPQCLHTFASKIFALGKTQMFLQLLSPSQRENSSKYGHLVTILSSDESWRGTYSSSLLPFSEAVNDMLRRWIDLASTDGTVALRTSLLQDHGLTNLLVAFPSLFFGRDGAAFNCFAEALLVYLQRSDISTSSNTRFMLTELARDTLGHFSGVENRGLFVDTLRSSLESPSGSMIHKLSYVKLGYSFNWAIQNITRCRSPEVHGKIFTFLLQLYRARSRLQSETAGFRNSVISSAATLKLRQSLLCFVSVVSYHVTATATGIHEEMLQHMASAQDVDSMVAVWSQYERRLEINLLLSAKLLPVHEAILRVMGWCELLSSETTNEAARPIQSRFLDMLRFLIAGVRGVSRVGGEAALEALAERLEWIMR